MKKIALTLILICLFGFGIKAQNNWKYIPSNEIISSSVSSQYTWAIYKGVLVQISNITKKAQTFKLPFDFFDFYTMQAMDDELVIVINNQVIHFQNGIWTVLLDFSNNSFTNIATVNESTGQIALMDNIYDKIYLIKDKRIKTLNFSGTYELGTLISIRNDNSIFFVDLKSSSSRMIEIDTNGVAKSYISKSKIGADINTIGKLAFNQNKLIFHSTKIGLCSINYNSLDTSVQNIASVNDLKLKEYRVFDIDNNNNIIIISHANSSKNIYYVMNLSGLVLDSAISPLIYGGALVYYGVTNINKLIFRHHTNELYTIDLFDWNLLFKSEHEYFGDDIKTSHLNSFVSDKRLYEFMNEKIINVNYDSLQTPNLSLSIVKKINNTKYLIGSDNGTINLYKKLENEYQKLVSEIPFPVLEGIKDIAVDSKNQIYILTSNFILEYKSDKTWAKIPCKTSNNISSVNSFCIDNSDKIWIATNKGIATIINNEIALEDEVNIRFNTINIIYSKTNNYLIFNLVNTIEERLYIHNLTTNESQSFKTVNYISKMLVNDNNEIYTLYKNYGLNKFDLSIMDWDTTFNNNTTGTPFEKRIYDFSIDEQNRIYLFKRIAYNLLEIYLYSEDGFLSSIISDNTKINVGLSLYPNPFKDQIHFESTEKLISYNILNTEGKIVQNGLIINNKINTNRLPNGTYFIQITSPKGVISKKIMKN